MSTKMWEAVVDHARTCMVDDKKLYLYCPPSLNRGGVVFNVVGQVLGVLSDHKYVVADNLPELERVSFVFDSTFISLNLHKKLKLVMFS